MHSIKQNTLQKQQHQDITILNVLPTDYMICVFLQVWLPNSSKFRQRRCHYNMY